jgi:predicted lipid carrier protein YhbT
MHGHLPSPFARLPLPLLPLEFVAQRLIGNALARRPSFFARLGPFAEATFAIDPVDCPFVFLITPGEARLRLRRELTGATHAARIAAPLIVLLGMLDGTYDGDALFFSRDLVIEGDTEAVLALRNAIEDAEFEPATALGLPAPLAGPVNRMANLMLEGVRRILDAPMPSGSRARQS